MVRRGPAFLLLTDLAEYEAKAMARVLVLEPPSGTDFSR